MQTPDSAQDDVTALPRLPRDLLARPALYARLNEWAPVTMVRGAQGYGKTTLVAAWLESKPSAEVEAIWIAGTQDIPDVVDIRARLSGLDQQVGHRKVVLVLDDDRSSTDPGSLARLVELTQRHRDFYLVLCSRGDPAMDAVVDATVDVNTIHGTDLLLDVDEIEELSALMGRPCKPEQAAAIVEHTGGWVAVVKLVLANSGNGAMDFSAADNYARSTVLVGIDDIAARTFVVRLAIPEQLELDLIADLAEGELQRQDMIAALGLTGFVSPGQVGATPVLFYPGLIRTVLRDLAAAEDQDGVRKLHEWLSDWYAGHDGPKHSLFAFTHAVAAADWDQALLLWDERAAAMVIDSLGQVIQAVQSIPIDIRRTRVSMVAALQIGDIFADGADGGKFLTALASYWQFSRAAIENELQGMNLPDLLFVGTGQLMALRIEGDLAASAQFAAFVDAQLRADQLPSRYDRFCWFQLQAGITDTLWGADDAARGRYISAWQNGLRTGANFIPANAASNLALHHALRGESSQRDRWLSERQRVSTEGQVIDFLATLGAQIAVGLNALDRLDPGGTETVLNIVGDGSWQLELWPFITYLAVQYALHFGDCATMLARLTEIEGVHPASSASGIAARLIGRARADLLMAVGEGQRALTELYRIQDQSTMVSVGLARAHLLARDYPRARAIAARSVLAADTCIRDRLDLALISAASALHMSDEPAAVAMFTRALAYGRESGNLQAFATMDPDDRAALFELSGPVANPFGAEEMALLARSRAVFAKQFTLIVLTGREQALIRELERTSVRLEIADALFVSINTVKSQLLALYHKLGTTTREETLMRIEELGLLR
jgi:DNA-binding NarL/FixJ family response regulator